MTQKPASNSASSVRVPPSARNFVVGWKVVRVQVAGRRVVAHSGREAEQEQASDREAELGSHNGQVRAAAARGQEAEYSKGQQEEEYSNAREEWAIGRRAHSTESIAGNKYAARVRVASNR